MDSPQREMTAEEWLVHLGAPADLAHERVQRERDKAVSDFADVILAEIAVAHDVGIRPTGEALQAWTYICDHFEAFINRRRPDRRRPHLQLEHVAEGPLRRKG